MQTKRTGALDLTVQLPFKSKKRPASQRTKRIAPMHQVSLHEQYSVCPAPPEPRVLSYPPAALPTHDRCRIRLPNPIFTHAEDNKISCSCDPHSFSLSSPLSYTPGDEKGAKVRDAVRECGTNGCLCGPR